MALPEFEKKKTVSIRKHQNCIRDTHTCVIIKLKRLPLSQNINISIKKNLQWPWYFIVSWYGNYNKHLKSCIYNFSLAQLHICIEKIADN